MIYTQNLEQLILTRHTQNNADELIILSGWTGPSPIQKLSKLPINSTIIQGIKSQLNKRLHLNYQQITANTKCNIYVKSQYNHSKIYCWLKNKSPVDILSGSANLSTQGLNNSHGGETLFDIKSKAHPKTYQYIQDALKNSVLSTKYTLPVISSPSVPTQRPTNQLDKILSFNPPTAEIYVGGRGKTMQDAAGWNWGHGGGHNTKDCAEQRIRGDLIKSIPSLFPNNGVNINAGSGQSSRNRLPNAEMIFDDGEVMDMSFEGLGVSNSQGQTLFKQFSSYPNKNIYGRYIRRRLGLSTTAKITDSDLIKHGKDTITLELLSPGVYFCDFS
jgi:hypothetical protein